MTVRHAAQSRNAARTMVTTLLLLAVVFPRHKVHAGGWLVNDNNEARGRRTQHVLNRLAREKARGLGSDEIVANAIHEIRKKATGMEMLSKRAALEQAEAIRRRDFSDSAYFGDTILTPKVSAANKGEL